MNEGARGVRRNRRLGLVIGLAVVFCLGIASLAIANNLDRRTAQNAAKEAARRECHQTSGCTGYGAKNVRLVTHHKAVGKIFVNSVKNGEKFQCRQQFVLHLDPDNGQLRYGLAHRRCTDLGPA